MLFKISKFFLCVSVLAVAIVTTTTLFPFIVGKYVWFRTSVAVALIFYLLGLVFDKSAGEYLARMRELVRSPIVIAVTVFTVAFLLAGFFGVNPSFSFWSNFERGEGGFQILTLYVFFALICTLFKEKRDWDYIMKWFFAAALLMICYGVAAGLKYTDAEWTKLPTGATELSGQGGPWFQTFKDFVGPGFSEPNYRFQGSFGNAAYVAAYLLFALFYVGYLLVSNYRGRLRSWGAIVLIALGVIFFVFFWLAATRGAFLGLLAGILVILAYLGYTKKRLRKWFLGIGLCLVILVVVSVAFRDNPFIKKLPSSRLFDLSFSADTFATRRIIWNMAWDGFKERPLLGFGPENFLTVFYKHFDTRYFVPSNGFGAWFDRAHSLVFDALAETGALGLLSYLSIFGMFFWLAFTHRKQKANATDAARPWQRESLLAKALLIAMPVSYLVQGIILFDVLVIYINLFFMFAFLAYEFFPNKEIQTKS